MRKLLFVTMLGLSLFTGKSLVGEDRTGNPLVPGYFADPTIKKFGDTYYIYSTTDGIKLGSGQPTVWISKDLKNWFNQEMEIDLPEGLTNCWAPDVIERNGNYYYYMGNCQFGCNIYGYESQTPIGPWKPIKNGEPVIPVGTGKENLPALDAQFFTDDNGDLYSHFGTWCTSFGGVGWAKIDTADMGTIVESGFIPIVQLPKAFEAFYMLKRNGKYILMYSAGDCKVETYAVHYAWADSPTGPFHYGQNNPILATNIDASVDGPGHHSMLKDGDDYYMFYHRHDNPHSTGGMFRQICMDKVVFLNDTTIATIKPSHGGIDFSTVTLQPKNIAWGARATASSEYHLETPANRYNKQGIDFNYKAELATDDNNGTLWRAETNSFPQSLTIDLGTNESIQRVMTQFEYATFYYQYKIETSIDGINWSLFADKTNNKTAGSPMIDDKPANGKFIKITITGAEKTGLMAAIWNIQVFNHQFDIPLITNNAEDENGVCGKGELLVDLNARTSSTKAKSLKNSGTLGGKFLVEGKPVVEELDGVKSVKLDGQSFFRLSEKAPKSLDWNAPFTAAVWVNNPSVEFGECLIAWNSRDDMLQGSYAAMMYGEGPFGAIAHGDGATDVRFKNLPEAGKWHHIVLTFDGMIEKVYVDGQLNTQIPMSLFVSASDILIGASGEPSENLTGNIARAQLFDKALSSAEIEKLMVETNPKTNK
jgi:beta-xylosidase